MTHPAFSVQPCGCPAARLPLSCCLQCMCTPHVIPNSHFLPCRAAEQVADWEAAASSDPAGTPHPDVSRRDSRLKKPRPVSPP